MNANPVCATNVYTRVFDVMRTRNGTRAVGVALVYLIGSACCGLSFDMYVYASFEYSLSSVLSFLFLRYYRWLLNFLSRSLPLSISSFLFSNVSPHIQFVQLPFYRDSLHENYRPYPLFYISV